MLTVSYLYTPYASACFLKHQRDGAMCALKRWACFQGRRRAPANADAPRPTGRGRRGRLRALIALISRKEGGERGFVIYVLHFPRDVSAEVTERTKVPSLAPAVAFAKGARCSNRNK